MRPIGITYSRVSNPNDQREASLESQEEAQVSLLESRGFDVPTEFRFRERYTGMESIYDRPVLLRVREIIASGQVSAVSCYDTDRLARDPRELLTVVADNHKHKVETIFVKMDHETKGRIGEMILYMKGFASALEWDAIRDRTMRGRQKIHGSGQWVGHGRPRYGYLWNKSDRSRTANPETAPVVCRIFALAVCGHSSRAIAKMLNSEGIHASTGRQWSGKTVRAIINDSTYMGVVVARKTMPGEGRTASGNHRMKVRPKEQQLVLNDARTEALVSEDVWSKANASLASNRSLRGRVSSSKNHMLAGYIWCGVCRIKKMAPTSYVCRKKTRVYRYRCGGCNSVVGARWVDDRAWTWISGKFCDPGYLKSEIAKLKAKEPGHDALRRDLKSAEARKVKCAKTVSRLLDDQATARSSVVQSAISDKLASLDREANELDQQIESLRARLGTSNKSGPHDLDRLVAYVCAKVARGDCGLEERQDIVKAIKMPFFAWTDGKDRHLCASTETEPSLRSRSRP